MDSKLKTSIAVVLGNICLALSVHLFLSQGAVITGGTTGLGMLISSISGIPASLFIFAFNIAMLILGFFILGKEFAMTTVASSILYPAALAVCEWLLPNLCLTTDPLLCAVFGGLGIGASLALVISVGSSTGGVDIPCLILYKFYRLPVSVSIYLCDVLILLLQASRYTPTTLLYGILHVLIYSLTLDRLILKGSSRTEVRIISTHTEELRNGILEKVDRGVTLLEAEGGYSREHRQIVMTLISNRELPMVEKLVHTIDPEAFLIVNRVSEISGRGFTMSKTYGNEN